MDTFVIEPDAADDRIVFQEGAPRRMATFAEPIETQPAPPPPAPSAPPPSTYRASRMVDTPRWMDDATCHLVDALLRPKMSKETAAAWSGVLHVDVAPALNRQAEREVRAAQALQASIEASSAERAHELAAERDRSLAAAQAAGDQLDAAADRCVEAIDAAVYAGSEVRKTMRCGRRDVDEVRRSLDRMCTPPSYRSWAPHIRAILDEEAEAAYRSLESRTETGLANVRRRRPALPSPPPPVVASNAHLQTLVDAMDARRKLRVVGRLQEAAMRSSSLLASCAACDGPQRRCVACSAPAEAA